MGLRRIVRFISSMLSSYTPLEIKIELMRAGITQAEIARGYDCSPVTVHKVIHGSTMSQGLQALIAKRLGRPVRKLFPERPALAA